MHHFQDIQDCPDIVLKKGEWVTLRYKLLWYGIERTYSEYQVMPLMMHLKDYIRTREKDRQETHRNRFPQGAPPKFSDIWVQITYGDPTRNPYTRS